MKTRLVSGVAQSHKICAVLTGDLVGSTRAGSVRVEHTMQILSRNLPNGIGWGWTAQDLRFTRFRGDGWQMLLSEPAVALRWSVVLLAALHADRQALGSRIAIGIGPVATIGSHDLSDASGGAFEASGRCLDAMHRDERLFLMGAETCATGTGRNGAGVIPAEKAATILINERISRWSVEQAEAAAHFLHPNKPPATEIAVRLGITPQAVSYRLKGAGAKALREALETLESGWIERWEFMA